MSIDKKHKDLLQKLIAGTISDHEQWQLERASLDDPFLADAIEGYRIEEANEETVSAIRKRLQSKNQPTKTRSLLWKRLSIAASLLILMSASFWMFKSYEASSINMSSAEKTVPSILENTADEMDVRAEQATEEESLVIEKEEGLNNSSKDKKAKTERNEPSPVVAKKSKKSSPDVPISTPPATADSKTLSETLADYEAAFQEEEVMDEIRVTEIKESKNEELLIPESAEDMVTTESTKSKVIEEVREKQKTTSKKAKVQTVPTEPQLDAAVLANAGPIEKLPMITQGLIVDSEGQPMRGVEILDIRNNKLVETDASGNFFLPEMDGYVITAFAGYDSMTVAVTPNLSIQLQKSSKTLSQPHKRIVDMMDDGELRNHYINELNVIFSRNWPICRQSRSVEVSQSQGIGTRLKNNTTVHLVIRSDGSISDPTFYDELPEGCSATILDLLKSAESADLFVKERPLSFTYRINF